MTAKGVNTLRLELEETRHELATTLDDIFATFNPGVQLRSHPVVFAAVLAAVAGVAAAVVLRGRSRGR